MVFGLIAWCVLVRFGGVAGLVVGAVGLLICFVFDLLELCGVVIGVVLGLVVYCVDAVYCGCLLLHLCC